MQQATNGESKNMVREPVLAAILSFFFMGLGQAYNGQRRKGYIFFASYIGLAALYFILARLFSEPLPKRGEEISHTSLSYLMTVASGFLIWLLNIYDAYRSAKFGKTGKESVEMTSGKSTFIFLKNVVLGFIIFFVSLLIIPLILVLVFRNK